MMICAWAGEPCDKPNCEHCAVRDRERYIRNINKLNFVFCVECVKAPECEKVKIEYIDGCWKGKAYYEEDCN